MHFENTSSSNPRAVICELPAPVPKSEGPGAPQVCFGRLPGTGATRHSLVNAGWGASWVDHASAVGFNSEDDKE